MGRESVLGAVEGFVDVLRDRVDRAIQFGLDPEHVSLVGFRDEVDRDTQMPEATSTTHTMEIGLCGLREIEIDHDVHRLDVDTSSHEIRRDQVTGLSIPEAMEDFVSLLLIHLRVDVETFTPHAHDRLRQEFHAHDTLAEDDGLVDVELLEEGRDTGDLLLLLQVGVELGDPLESEFFHLVDQVCPGVHVGPLEIADGFRIGRREEEHLAVVRNVFQEICHDTLEVVREEFVCLIQDEHPDLVHLRDVPVREIQETTGGGDDDMDRVHETHDVFREACTTGADHDLDTEVLGDVLHDVGSLESELSGRDDHDSLDVRSVGIDSLQDRHDEARSLSGPVLRASHDVMPLECEGDTVLLDRSRLFPAHLVDPLEEVPVELEVFELHLLRPLDIFSPDPVVRGWSADAGFPGLALLLDLFLVLGFQLLQSLKFFRTLHLSPPTLHHFHESLCVC